MLEKYLAACHAMQSGVAMEMNWDSKPTEPKHLRVGINTSMCDHAALVKLLIAKEIITEKEYYEAITKEMEEEVKRYEDRINKHYGTDSKITLG